MSANLHPANPIRVQRNRTDGPECGNVERYCLRYERREAAWNHDNVGVHGVSTASTGDAVARSKLRNPGAHLQDHAGAAVPGGKPLPECLVDAMDRWPNSFRRYSGNHLGHLVRAFENLASNGQCAAARSGSLRAHTNCAEMRAD